MPASAGLHRMHRQFEGGEQAGSIVVEHQFALVQVRDRFSEREAKSRAFVGPARIEASEAAPGFVAAVSGNAGTAVGDLDFDVTVALAYADADFAPCRTVTDRILDEVAD